MKLSARHPRRLSTRLIAGLAALVVVAAASATAVADTQKVGDRKRETKALRDNGRVDIVRATAGHRGKLLAHTVTVRGRINPDERRERPLIGINTRGNNASDPEYLVYGSSIFKNRKLGESVRIGSAQLRSRKRTWTYVFDPAAFGGRGLGVYGWAAFTTTKKALDVVPRDTYAVHDAKPRRKR